MSVQVQQEIEGVLDPKQLGRIEAVHRGFLYQHLYAVHLVLRMPGSDVRSIAIERDEDVEVRRPGLTVYIQVKTRGGKLALADIADAVDRFEGLREAHRRGDRAGDAAFVIVANTAPSDRLAIRMDADDWPEDVVVLQPDGGAAHGLPVAARSINDALAACEKAAEAVPFGGLAPATLVLKLAAVVQHAATGARSHAITAEELPELLEHLVEQLQDFPDPPRPYHPQRGEPDILSPQRVRLLMGFSGAGKTAWAAETARHRPEPIAYFDVPSGLPPASIASNLAREIVARFLGQSGWSARLPPAGGVDMLRAADALLAEREVRALVVLDNVHLLQADEFRQVVEAAPHTSFLALAQPWPGGALIEATLGIEAGYLKGYDADAVAAVFVSEDVNPGLAPAKINPALSAAYRHLFGRVALQSRHTAPRGAFLRLARDWLGGQGVSRGLASIMALQRKFQSGC